jgi:hypothetical protein
MLFSAFIPDALRRGLHSYAAARLAIRRGRAVYRSSFSPALKGGVSSDLDAALKGRSSTSADPAASVQASTRPSRAALPHKARRQQSRHVSLLASRNWILCTSPNGVSSHACQLILTPRRGFFWAVQAGRKYCKAIYNNNLSTNQLRPQSVIRVAFHCHLGGGKIGIS